MNHTNLFHFFKKGLPLFSLLSLALILWNCNPISSKPSELIDWIPQNSSWVIQINDANTLTSELTNNEVFKEIKLLNKRLTADISNLLSGAPDVESLLCVTKVGKNPVLPPSRLRRGICHNNRHIVIIRRSRSAVGQQ